jgi:hypothetical protein
VPTRRSDSVKEMARAVIGLAAFKETRSVSRYHRIHVTEFHLYGLDQEIPKKSRKSGQFSYRLGAHALTA